MTRAAILSDLERAETMFETRAYEDASKLLQKVFDDVHATNFFPLLEPILVRKISVNRCIKRRDEFLIDSLMITSPTVRPREADLRLTELLCYTEQPEDVTIDVPEKYRNCVPFKCTVKYAKDDVVVGEPMSLNASFTSLVGGEIRLSDLIVWVLRSNGREDIVAFGSFDAKPHDQYSFAVERVVSEKCTWERVSSIGFKINQVLYKVPVVDVQSLRVHPRPGLCRVDTEVPELILVDSEIHVRVKITPLQMALHNAIFVFDCEDAISITGKNGESEFGKRQETRIGQVEMDSTVLIPLVFRSHCAAEFSITCHVMFDTDDSIGAEVEDTVNIIVRDAFIIRTQFFDSNMRIIENLEQSGSVFVETSLTNNTSKPITVENIDVPFECLYCDLPIDLQENECYTFMGKVSIGGKHKAMVHYKVNGNDDAVFCLDYKSVNISVAPFAAVIECPTIVTKNEPFKVTLRIENVTEHAKIVRVEVQTTKTFMTMGPTRREIPVLGKRRKVVVFDVVACSSGSAVLPEIVVSTDKPIGIETFVMPLIVVH